MLFWSYCGAKRRPERPVANCHLCQEPLAFIDAIGRGGCLNKGCPAYSLWFHPWELEHLRAGEWVIERDVD